MPSGFQAYNEYGALQIDVQKRPYVLMTKGTIGVPTLNQYDTDNWTNSPGNVASFTYNGITQGYQPYLSQGNSTFYTYYSPKLVLQCTDAYATIVAVDRSTASSVTWYIRAGNRDGTTANAGFAIVNINYFIFDVLPTNGTKYTETHNGLNLYGADGKLFYSSEYKPLRLMGRSVGPTGAITTSGIYDTLDAPAGFAGSMGAIMYDHRFATYQRNSAWFRYQEGVRITSAGAQTNRVLVETNPVYHQTRSSVGATILLADITGY